MMGAKAGTSPDAALKYVAEGWAVFPCEPRGKKPLTANGFKDATTDAGKIREWWGKWPDANVGSPMGGNRIVIDMDGTEADAPMMELERTYGPLPETLQAKTGRGHHLYFNPKGAKVKPSAGELGPHLDIRGEGSYVILPPSIHASGTRYEWVDETAPIAELPEAWRKLLSGAARPEARAQPDGDTIPEGQRNSHLASLAGSMRRPGMTVEAIEAALLQENKLRCEPPLPDAEVKGIAQSVARYEPAKQPNASGFTLTSLGELFAKPDTPVDYVWDGRLAAGTVSGVFAKPKVGKGTLARNLCLAVSRGESFLGLATRQGDCIYLALEEQEEDIKRDFRAMGADGTEPILVHAAAAPAEGIHALCDLVRDRKPRLVVIDPIIRLARIRDEKAYSDTYNALGPLIDAARETGTHVMFLHHSSKSQKADAVDSPLGSTGFAAVVATLINLKRTEAYRTIQTVQRIGEDMPETILQFDSESKRLSIGETRDEAETEAISAEILGILEAAAESKTEPEITGTIEGKTKLMRRTLRQLVEHGKVSREGGGKRGDPYRYRFSFACSQYIAGTREQESEKATDTRINTGSILVPASEQKPILVPGMGERHFSLDNNT